MMMAAAALSWSMEPRAASGSDEELGSIKPASSCEEKTSASVFPSCSLSRLTMTTGILESPLEPPLKRPVTNPMPIVSRNGARSMTINAARSRKISLRSLIPISRSFFIVMLALRYSIFVCLPNIEYRISLISERSSRQVQEHRFEIRLTNIDRADLDAAFVGLGDDCCQHLFRFMSRDRDFMVAGTGFQDIFHAIQ